MHSIECPASGYPVLPVGGPIADCTPSVCLCLSQKRKASVNLKLIERWFVSPVTDRTDLEG